jgi:hypothetical protein
LGKKEGKQRLTMNRRTAVKHSIFYGMLILVWGSVFYCASPSTFTQKTCYDRAVVLADSLAKINVQRQGYDCDCRKILEKYLQLREKYLRISTVKDSLERVIVKVSEGNKGMRYAARKQNWQLDSLSDIITTQKRAIEKLLELDIKQEQQRSKIQ